MSRAYLAEWVRQLCVETNATLDVHNLSASELTRLILSLVNSGEPAGDSV